MSTSPDLVQSLSGFLAGHLDVEKLSAILAGAGDLGPESQRLVAELREELSRPDVARPELQPLVRETIEAIALGQ